MKSKSSIYLDLCFMENVDAAFKVDFCSLLFKNKVIF